METITKKDKKILNWMIAFIAWPMGGNKSKVSTFSNQSQN